MINKGWIGLILFLLLFDYGNAQLLPGGQNDNYEYVKISDNKSSLFFSINFQMPSYMSEWHTETGIKVGNHWESGYYYDFSFIKKVSKYEYKLSDYQKTDLKSYVYGVDLGYLQSYKNKFNYGGHVSLFLETVNLQKGGYNIGLSDDDYFLGNEFVIESNIKLFNFIWFGIDLGYRLTYLNFDDSIIKANELSGPLIGAKVKFYVL